jgi:HEAT repeat protein
LAADLAARALAKAGHAAVLPVLEALTHLPQQARILAFRALAEIGDPRAIPAMLNAFRDDSALARFWAGQGLERLGFDMVLIKP